MAKATKKAQPPGRTATAEETGTLKAARGKAAREKAAKVKMAKDKAEKDRAAKARLGKDKAAKLAKAKAAKVKAAKDKLGKAKLGKAKVGKLLPARWKAEPVHAALPVPLDVPPVAAPPRLPKGVRKAETRHLAPLDPGEGAPVPAVLERLHATILQRRKEGDVENSHSARLLARGTAKVAQKLGEEAVETVIEALSGNRPALIGESADLLYHLIGVWVDAGIAPADVWAELVRREGISGIAEKASRQNLSPAGVIKAGRTTKLA